ncbi:50S ribosomal protein L6 [Membranihabitans marinus]|uniref:50S ribosomal protein L6 n=1 Tax=Membranihabitans marinus TaxID=1227546 RepID=UPI001F00E141|nr:50S ribosomal protein L6 [Membranihabitans marinus]
MSRIGLRVLEIPKDVKIEVSKGNLVKVKGPKGELSEQIDTDLEISIDEKTVQVARPTEQIRHKALHGLSNALINNMLIGVSEGYKKVLELVGVGFRVSNSGNLLEIAVGYSHPIYFYVPDELKVTTTTEKGKSPAIILEGCDKQLLGMVAAKIRSFRKPEPYKGKGIRYSDEYVRRKAGKTAAK